MQNLFFFGILAGATIGIPIGPNGTLCLYRSVRFGWTMGVATAFGSVAAMSIYSITSFLILSFFIEMIPHTNGGNVITGISATFSIVIGIVFLMAPKSGQEKTTERSVQKLFFLNFFSSFLISISNPKNIIGFAALLIAYSPVLGSDGFTVINAASFGFGVFLSTAFLFMLLIYLSITVGELFLKDFIPKLKYWVAAVFILSGVIAIGKII